MASIILDVVIEECSLEDYVAATETLYDLKLTVINENGPAGGWPEIKFEGRRKRVEAYIRVYSGHDPRVYEDLFDSIVD